jgi:sulfur carrier protein
MGGAGRHLPVEFARHVAILADQEDGIAIDEGQDAHGARALDHPVDGAAAVGQHGHVLAHPDPGIGIDRARRRRRPGDAGERGAVIAGAFAARTVARGRSVSSAHGDHILVPRAIIGRTRMKVTLRYPKRQVEITGKRRVKELLRELDVIPETVLVIRGSELLTADTVVGEDDEIELRPVISGGGAR